MASTDFAGRNDFEIVRLACLGLLVVGLRPGHTVGRSVGQLVGSFGELLRMWSSNDLQLVVIKETCQVRLMFHASIQNMAGWSKRGAIENRPAN